MKLFDEFLDFIFTLVGYFLLSVLSLCYKL